jgi:hypothetical protein
MPILTVDADWKEAERTHVESNLIHFRQDTASFLRTNSASAYTVEELAERFNLADYANLEIEHVSTDFKSIKDLAKDAAKDIGKNLIVEASGEMYKEKLVKYQLAILERDDVVEARDVHGVVHYSYRG